MAGMRSRAVGPRRTFVPLLVAAVLGGVVTVMVIALVGAGSASPARKAASVPVTSSGTRRNVDNTALTATQVYQQDSAGVVAITARTSEGEDKGTGIVINDEGLILTNDHVVAGATAMQVSADGSASHTAAAQLVGEEANSDLALIKVDPSGLGLKPLTIADSASVQIGAQVYAIGNPYGLEETLTKGIVSALNREIAAPDGAKISGVIQTDAALNPGNSGRPAPERTGRSDRRQLPDRQRCGALRRVPAGQHRCRLRDLDGDRRQGRESDRVGPWCEQHAGDPEPGTERRSRRR